MWDWITFGVCVASIVPSAVLIAILIRYLLRHSDQRIHCFKDSSSEDCEILVSTTTRAPLTHEFLREFTHSRVISDGSGSTQPTEPPPLYSSIAATTQLSVTGNELNASGMQSAAALAPASSTTRPSPPLYGSDNNVSMISPPSYAHLTQHYHAAPSSMPAFNLNFIITSLDLLPEMAAIPPPPTYDQARDHVRF